MILDPLEVTAAYELKREYVQVRYESYIAGPGTFNFTLREIFVFDHIKKHANHTIQCLDSYATAEAYDPLFMSMLNDDEKGVWEAHKRAV